MIDPMKYKYLVAIMTADKKAYDITQFVEDVSWEEGENQLAARISFSAKNDKTSKGKNFFSCQAWVLCSAFVFL